MILLFISFLTYLNIQVTVITSQSINVANSYVTWRNLGTETEFNITSKLEGLNVQDAWIALGLNNLPQMSGTNAVVCRYASTVLKVHHYLNSGYSSSLLNPTDPYIGLLSSKVQVFDSNLTCSFRRENSVDFKGYININELSSLNIIVAYNIGDFGRHYNRGASSKVSFKLMTVSTITSTKAGTTNSTREEITTTKTNTTTKTEATTTVKGGTTNSTRSEATTTVKSETFSLIILLLPTIFNIFL